jgi:fumarylacetoacetate (FAA) hydrolase
MRLVSFRVLAGTTHVGRLEGDRVVELAAPSMLDWLRGDGHSEVGRDHAVEDLVLLAPIPEPPSFRDFFSYEGHAATGARLRGTELSDHWYEVPVFYFSNPASIMGPGEPIRRPPRSHRLDLELEIAGVIGEDGAIAGYTLLNDWSARDVQRREMSVGLGPAKAKDFATSMGPWLVTPDELPIEDGRLQITASAMINGDEITRSRAGEQHWSWPQIVAHAARGTRLRPGDVLGSGTLNRGCLLELNADASEPKWLEPGDVVAIEADGLGRLESPIV